MIRLGATVKDKVTGFKGIVSGRVEYLTGCAQLLVQPKVDDKGGWVESRWLDEMRAEVLVAPLVVIEWVEEAPLSMTRLFGADREAPKK